MMFSATLVRTTLSRKEDYSSRSNHDKMTYRNEGMPEESYDTIKNLLACARPEELRQGLELVKKEIAESVPVRPDHFLKWFRPSSTLTRWIDRTWYPFWMRP
jgi:hypothetical protein